MPDSFLLEGITAAMSIQQHPDRESLTSFACGRVDPQQAAELERHVASCDTCCRVVAAAQDDPLVDLARAAVETLGPIGDTDAGEVGPNRDTPAGAGGDLLVPPAALQDHGRYRILRALGRGGMGMVFLAEHRLMKRLVALKVINPRLVNNATAVARFRQEVEAAASLSHPNIVTAHDAEQAGDTHFLVMEFVKGESLDRFVIKSGPLSVEQACDFIRQAANGLQHAHERGMVHRDIKPQNLILTDEGTVKVLDFGLTRLASELSSGSEKLTKDHIVLGTPDFIAPEQAEDSRTVDARSDIYSLGCTLYYLLAAQVPFPVDSSMLKLSSHLLVEPKPVSALRGDVPAGLVAVIEKMMAKEPSQRFRHAGEVSRALEQFAAPRSDSARQPARSTMSRRSVLSVAATLLGLVSISLLVGWWRSDGQDPLVSETAPEALFLLAPDGLWFPDYGPVHEVLENNGVTITVASSRREITLNPHGGGAGVEVRADVLLDELRARRFDVIILCGGMVEPFCNRSPAASQVRTILREHLDRNMFVAAICQGQEILARGGMLRDVRCARPFVHDWDEATGVQWDLDNDVLRSGQFITGSDPDHAEEFAREILKWLGRME